MKKRRSSTLPLILVFLLILIGASVTIVIALDSMTTGGSVGSACVVDSGEETYRLSPEQMGNAALIAGVGLQTGAGNRGIEIALATAMQESSLRNLDYGDLDSLGLFQQRPSQGWGTPEQVQDPVYAASIFYDRLQKVAGWQDLPLTVAAQAVQISAFPDAYAKHEPLAAGLRAALTGAGPATLTCSLPESTGLDTHRLTSELNAAHPEAGIAVVGPGAMLSVGADASTAQVWALAHWAVATAAWTGASEVHADGHVWTRDGGWHVDDAAASDAAPGTAARDTAEEPDERPTPQLSHVSVR